ncbi:hypothetical protein F8M41_018113 [Gigaspora margarita]|uniref:Uncharacterized protein n=1 Tax=Gigaspora margarita TaxID=4874 RepID=A0A8H4EU83_GIGMA|nr:hypothetical protein F8M41_018113 [Gigaspora margarita]
MSINIALPSIEELFLENDDIKTLKDNRVSGPAFLELTLKELLASPYELPGGPAKVIAKLIKTIKGVFLIKASYAKKSKKFSWTVDFSNLSLKELKTYIHDQLYFPEEVDPEDLILCSIRGDSETYNSHFIIPFLAVASTICGNKAQIYPKEYIQGRYGCGPVDFCMKLENIIISVVKVKRDDFIQGVAQIIVQVHSSLENSRKQKCEIENDLVIDKVYGIVTDSKFWYFFECFMNGNKPEYKIHSEHGTTINWGGNIEEGVTEILGQIVWLLKDVGLIIESAKQKKVKLVK